MNITEILLIWR